MLSSLEQQPPVNSHTENGPPEPRKAKETLETLNSSTEHSVPKVDQGVQTTAKVNSDGNKQFEARYLQMISAGQRQLQASGIKVADEKTPVNSVIPTFEISSLGVSNSTLHQSPLWTAGITFPAKSEDTGAPRIREPVRSERDAKVVDSTSQPAIPKVGDRSAWHIPKTAISPDPLVTGAVKSRSNFLHRRTSVDFKNSRSLFPENNNSEDHPPVAHPVKSLVSKLDKDLTAHTFNINATPQSQPASPSLESLSAVDCELLPTARGFQKPTTTIQADWKSEIGGGNRNGNMSWCLVTEEDFHDSVAPRDCVSTRGDANWPVAASGASSPLLGSLICMKRRYGGSTSPNYSNNEGDTRNSSPKAAKTSSTVPTSVFGRKIPVALNELGASVNGVNPPLSPVSSVSDNLNDQPNFGASTADNSVNFEPRHGFEVLADVRGQPAAISLCSGFRQLEAGQQSNNNSGTINLSNLYNLNVQSEIPVPDFQLSTTGLRVANSGSFPPALGLTSNRLFTTANGMSSPTRFIAPAASSKVLSAISAGDGQNVGKFMARPFWAPEPKSAGAPSVELSLAAITERLTKHLDGKLEAEVTEVAAKRERQPPGVNTANLTNQKQDRAIRVSKLEKRNEFEMRDGELREIIDLTGRRKGSAVRQKIVSPDKILRRKSSPVDFGRGDVAEDRDRYPSVEKNTKSIVHLKKSVPDGDELSKVTTPSVKTCDRAVDPTVDRIGGKKVAADRNEVQVEKAKGTADPKIGDSSDEAIEDCAESERVVLSDTLAADDTKSNVVSDNFHAQDKKGKIQVVIRSLAENETAETSEAQTDYCTDHPPDRLTVTITDSKVDERPESKIDNLTDNKSEPKSDDKPTPRTEDKSNDKLGGDMFADRVEELMSSLGSMSPSIQRDDDLPFTKSETLSRSSELSELCSTLQNSFSLGELGGGERPEGMKVLSKDLDGTSGEEGGLYHFSSKYSNAHLSFSRAETRQDSHYEWEPGCQEDPLGGSGPFNNGTMMTQHRTPDESHRSGSLSSQERITSDHLTFLYEFLLDLGARMGVDLQPVFGEPATQFISRAADALLSEASYIQSTMQDQERKLLLFRKDIRQYAEAQAASDAMYKHLADAHEITRAGEISCRQQLRNRDLLAAAMKEKIISLLKSENSTRGKMIEIMDLAKAKMSSRMRESRILVSILAAKWNAHEFANAIHSFAEANPQHSSIGKLLPQSLATLVLRDLKSNVIGSKPKYNKSYNFGSAPPHLLSSSQKIRSGPERSSLPPSQLPFPSPQPVDICSSPPFKPTNNKSANGNAKSIRHNSIADWMLNNPRSSPSVAHAPSFSRASLPIIPAQTETSGRRRMDSYAHTTAATNWNTQSTTAGFTAPKDLSSTGNRDSENGTAGCADCLHRRSPLTMKTVGTSTPTFWKDTFVSSRSMLRSATVKTGVDSSEMGSSRLTELISAKGTKIRPRCDAESSPAAADDNQSTTSRPGAATMGAASAAGDRQESIRRKTRLPTGKEIMYLPSKKKDGPKDAEPKKVADDVKDELISQLTKEDMIWLQNQMRQRREGKMQKETADSSTPFQNKRRLSPETTPQNAPLLNVPVDESRETENRSTTEKKPAERPRDRERDRERDRGRDSERESSNRENLEPETQDSTRVRTASQAGHAKTPSTYSIAFTQSGRGPPSTIRERLVAQSSIRTKQKRDASQVPRLRKAEGVVGGLNVGCTTGLFLGQVPLVYQANDLTEELKRDKSDLMSKTAGSRGLKKSAGQVLPVRNDRSEQEDNISKYERERQERKQETRQDLSNKWNTEKDNNRFGTTARGRAATKDQLEESIRQEKRDSRKEPRQSRRQVETMMETRRHDIKLTPDTLDSTSDVILLTDLTKSGLKRTTPSLSKNLIVKEDQKSTSAVDEEPPRGSLKEYLTSQTRVRSRRRKVPERSSNAPAIGPGVPFNAVKVSSYSNIDEAIVSGIGNGNLATDFTTTSEDETRGRLKPYERRRQPSANGDTVNERRRKLDNRVDDETDNLKMNHVINLSSTTRRNKVASPKQRNCSAEGARDRDKDKDKDRDKERDQDKDKDREKERDKKAPRDQTTNSEGIEGSNNNSTAISAPQTASKGKTAVVNRVSDIFQNSSSAEGTKPSVRESSALDLGPAQLTANHSSLGPGKNNSQNATGILDRKRSQRESQQKDLNSGGNEKKDNPEGSNLSNVNNINGYQHTQFSNKEKITNSNVMGNTKDKPLISNKIGMQFNKTNRPRISATALLSARSSGYSLEGTDKIENQKNNNHSDHAEGNKMIESSNLNRPISSNVGRSDKETMRHRKLASEMPANRIT